jgi:hypothetical protein
MRLSLLIAMLVACQNKSMYSGTLADVINSYRMDNGLPSIAISPSLTVVAELHAADLYENRPNVGKCNMHSWSDQGEWSDCCYTDDHAEASCMWSKPSELSDYQSNGYEISAMSSAISPNTSLDIWRKSEPHHNVILNLDIWSDKSWLAIGGAIVGDYGVVWFGEEEDSLSE